ncbi:LOW QUALITY PROTEIN: malate synthase AcuE [Aspergillus luchuensis]|uniref:Malate synthase AcuE n=1 Tax=Aspergillus kawachii TaxID=1069201 RepID=A0A146FXH8_ASPKA|nr:LOW QUALITY PROTEIN: malate synthase AcuE [Aspergillus luchuensis]
MDSVTPYTPVLQMISCCLAQARAGWNGPDDMRGLGMDSIHFAPTVVSKSLCWRWTLHCTNESLPLLPQQLDILHTTLQPGMGKRQEQTFPED